MSDPISNEPATPSDGEELQDRRRFLQGTGKWSGAAIIAAVAGTMFGTTQEASAGWINRRGGGGWLNGGGGGGWINGGGGGGGWINRRVGGGSWINR